MWYYTNFGPDESALYMISGMELDYTSIIAFNYDLLCTAPLLMGWNWIILVQSLFCGDVQIVKTGVAGAPQEASVDDKQFYHTARGAPLG